MTALDVIRASNEWDEPWSYAAVRYYFYRYPWTAAFLILFVAMCVGFFRVDQISDGRAVDRQQRIAENLARDRQFCRAIPNATAAGAQALINIVLAQAIQRDAPKSEIDRIKRDGALYVAEARRLSEADLPECERILDSP